MARLAGFLLLAVLLTGCADTNQNGQPDTFHPEARKAAGRTAEAAARYAAEAAKNARTASGIRSRLSRDPLVRLYRIEAEVENGTATLTGEVHTAREKARAEELARRQEGVTEVRNRIKVRQGS